MMKSSLYLYADVRRGADYVVDWIARVVRQRQQQQPFFQGENFSAIILPHQEMAIWLRKILASRRCSFINIHFWTPEHLRSYLLRIELLQQISDFHRFTIARREELHVILSSVAGTLAAEKSEQQQVLFMRAVEADPALFLRVLDTLDSADLRSRDVFKNWEGMRDLAEAFYAALEKQGLYTVSAMDCLLAAARNRLAAKFDSLLVFGFHGGHWPLFPLLSTASQITQNLDVLLDAPRDASFDLDSAWVGTWEQVLTLEALPLQEEDGRQQETKEQHARCVEFLAEESTQDLARAIGLRALEMLEEGAESIAIVFSTYGVLSREVALVLNELEIPHYDAIGHTFLESNPLWRSWCTFQKSHTVQAFSSFLTTLSSAYPNGQLPRENRYASAIRLLQEASRETLNSDICVCREFVRVHHGSSDGNKEIMRELMAYKLLPEEASFAEFCDAVYSEFSQLGWEEQIECLRKRREHFCNPAALLMKRSIFLRWLEAALRQEYRTRDAMGSHPYAAIQLVRREQAAACSWSHVLLAGMNVGDWPEPLEKNGFLPADTIAHFNGKIAAANNSSQIQGIFGEGHFAVTRIPCLGPQERYLLQRRDFQSLCQALHLVAATQLKNDLAVSSRPSLWFSELFHEWKGRPPSLRDLKAAIPPRKKLCVSPQQIEEVTAARKARLDAAAPFGAWEFSRSSCSSFFPSFSVVDVERILREPALVWMKTFLGVESPENETFPWGMTLGIWTHRWLRNIAHSGWAAFPDKASRYEAILSASEVTRATVEKIFYSFQKQIPPWWIALWQQARTFAFQFSDQLESFRSRFAAIATEVAFYDVRIAPFTFPLRGRWDLLLCDQVTHENKPSSALFIIDYKTGQQDLKFSSLQRDGTGIQLALYSYVALALWGGVRKIDATWMTPQQISLETLTSLTFKELEKVKPLLLSLDKMIRQGDFGMREKLRSEFGFQRAMPLATLFIPQDVLEAKWKLTYKFFGKTEES